MSRILYLIALALVLVACGGENTSASGEATSATAPSAPAADAAPTGATGTTPAASTSPVLLPAEIELKNSEGTQIWDLEPRDDGAKLFGAEAQEVARYTVNDSGKIIVKGPDDVRLYELEGQAGKWRITPGEGEDKLWILQRQDDGDWKLENGDETLIAKIKRRDYGWKVVDANEDDRFKAKTKGDKTSLRDANDSTFLYTKDPVPSLALALCGFDELPPAVRFAFALRIIKGAE